VAKGRLEGALSGTLRVHSYVLVAEGRVFVQGLPAPIVGAMAENASLFLTYNELQNVIRQWNHTPASTQLPLGQLMIAAAGAGAVASFLL
jgi:ornithine carrier protein